MNTGTGYVTLFTPHPDLYLGGPTTFGLPTTCQAYRVRPITRASAHGYRSWPASGGQILWAFGKAVDPDTGENVPLCLLPEAKEPVGSNLNSRRAHLAPIESDAQKKT